MEFETKAGDSGMIVDFGMKNRIYLHFHEQKNNLIWNLWNFWSQLPDGDKNHGKNQIFSQQRHNEWRRGDDFNNQQKEHVETNQNRYRKRYLYCRYHGERKREKKNRTKITI